MRGLAILSILLLLAAGTASAGPWPRAAGETYVFVGQAGGSDGWTSFYAESGLPNDLTLGLDAGGHAAALMARDLTGPLNGRVRAFLRVPLLSSPERRAARPGWAQPWLAALEFGLGPDLEKDGSTPLRYSAGLSLGRPLDTRFGPGWTTLDLRATLGGGRPARFNAGYVAGVRPTDRLALELGVFAEHEEDTSWAVAPTLQYEFGGLGAARIGLSFRNEGETRWRLGWARTF